MSEELKKDFCITHFFNPVRYMGLLELVTGPINDQEKIKLLKSFCDEKLGKGVILCYNSDEARLAIESIMRKKALAMRVIKW